MVKNARPPGGGAGGLTVPDGKSQPRQSERSPSENKERAYIAASRRSDRSIDARVQSAKMASIIHKERTGKGLKISEDIVLKEEMYEEEDDPPRPNIFRELPAKFQDFATIHAAMHHSVANPAFLARGASVAQVERDFERIFGAMTRPPVHPSLDMVHPPPGPPPPPAQQTTGSPAQVLALRIDTSLQPHAGPAVMPSPLVGQNTPGGMLSPGMSPGAALGSPAFTFGGGGGVVHAHHPIASPMTTPNPMFPQMSSPLHPDHMMSRSQSLASEASSSGPHHMSAAPSHGAAVQGLRRARQASSGLRSALHTPPAHSTASTPSGEPLSKRRRSEYDAPLAAAAAAAATPGPPMAHFTAQLPQNVQDIFAGAWMSNMQQGWQLDGHGAFAAPHQRPPMVLQDPPPPRRNQHRHSVPLPSVPMSRVSSQDGTMCLSQIQAPPLTTTTQPAAPEDYRATPDTSSLSPTLASDDSAATLHEPAVQTPAAAAFENDLALFELAKTDTAFDWGATDPAGDFSAAGDFNIDDFLNMSQSQDADNTAHAANTNHKNNGESWF